MGEQLVASPNIVPIDTVLSQNHMKTLDTVTMSNNTIKVGLISYWLFHYLDSYQIAFTIIILIIYSYHIAFTIIILII